MSAPLPSPAGASTPEMPQLPPTPAPSTPSTTPTAPLQPWRDEFVRVNATLKERERDMKVAVRKNVGSPILRVNQLDAIILDSELYEMLKYQFLRVFAFFREDFVDVWKPELEGALKTLIFCISIGARNYSYGQQLQNLTFGDMGKRTKTAFWLFSVGVPYLLQRWFVLYKAGAKWMGREDVPEHPEASTLRRIHTIEKVYQVLNTLNFLMFLWNGAYVSLLHRLLGLKQVYLKRQTIRRIGFEYMNRQLIWNGFTEFMLFILPMIPFTRISRTIRWLANVGRKAVGFVPGASDVHFDDSTCPICQSSIQIPFQTNCGHRYCYYCLKVATMSEAKPPCNICGNPITSIQRYQST